MAQIEKTKKHLLVKRAKIIKFLKFEGYNGEEIGFLVGIDRSGVSRILSSYEKYKKSVKNMLRD